MRSLDIPACPVCGAVPDEYYISYSGGDGIGYVLECRDFAATDKCKDLDVAARKWKTLVSSAHFRRFRRKETVTDGRSEQGGVQIKPIPGFD